MAKTLNEAGVKRLIQEIKGANKNLNAPIPISMENTPESKAQNVKNIADYVEKVKAAGIADVNGMAVTCIIDGDYSGVGYIYKVGGVSYINGIITCEDASNPFTFVVQGGDGTYMESELVTRSSNNQITSYMLVEGARKPIILTPETTEVDEETYQKLLSDDVDVVFKISPGGTNLCTLTYKVDNGDYLALYFTCLSMESSAIYDSYLYAYEVDITKTSPHTCRIIENVNDTLDSFIDIASFLKNSTLSSVLQEIDLSGTDADRKAKLDQFETYWKALTGASDLKGARFVGLIDAGDYGFVTALLIFDYNMGVWEGIGNRDDSKQCRVQVDPTGTLHITPLFSHLEAVSIETSNSAAAKVDNIDALQSYIDNLVGLGVTDTLGIEIPICINGTDNYGILVGDEHTRRFKGFAYYDNIPVAISISTDGTVTISNLQTQVDNTLNTESKNITGAINEVNTLVKKKADKSLNAKSLEAITIRTGNTTDDNAANIAAIKAYVDNLIALGVDVTGGYMIPVCFSDTELGYVMYHPFSTGSEYTGIITGPGGASSNIAIEKNGYAYVTTHIQPVESSLLTTTVKTIVPAINEVNAIAKSKQDKLTSGTNIKTVNGQSLLGSGDITISGGGGSAPVLVDIDDISGSAGDSVPVDVFNKIANAASAKTPIFGYSKLVDGQKTTYEIIPLYVKHISITDTNGFLSIQFIAESAYNSIGIVKRSDTECSILTNPPRPFALDTSVDKSSTRGIQSSAVWNEIHSEPMTVNTATSGVTTLSSTDKHKILCYADSGTQQYNLPPSPVDGETFLFLKVKSGHTITIQSGTDNQNIYDCSSGNSVVSKTIASSTKSKITVTYSSTVDKWFLMADDFLS